MANYAKADARRAQMAEWARRVEIARRITSLQLARTNSFALWMFCMWCAHRRLANAEWIWRYVPDAPDPLEALSKKLWCTGCGKQGGVFLIVAPYDFSQHPLDMRKAEIRDLILKIDAFKVE